jgi:hypothetical protein
MPTVRSRAARNRATVMARSSSAITPKICLIAVCIASSIADAKIRRINRKQLDFKFWQILVAGLLTFNRRENRLAVSIKIMRTPPPFKADHACRGAGRQLRSQLGSMRAWPGLPPQILYYIVVRILGQA